MLVVYCERKTIGHGRVVNQRDKNFTELLRINRIIWIEMLYTTVNIVITVVGHKWNSVRLP